MAYFVTGATGFIGSNLIPLLLKRTMRSRGAAGEIHMLVRESSVARMERRIDAWAMFNPAARTRLKPVVGDLRMAGASCWASTRKSISLLRERGIAHFFHLAAIYDMTAGNEVNQLANVEGTAHAIQLADAIGARVFHHVSSVAVAGKYRGVFTEDMFDVGQPLDHLSYPPHQVRVGSCSSVRPRLCRGGSPPGRRS